MELSACNCAFTIVLLMTSLYEWKTLIVLKYVLTHFYTNLFLYCGRYCNLNTAEIGYGGTVIVAI